jgi:very-short-patch-repair endonuclease
MADIEKIQKKGGLLAVQKHILKGFEEAAVINARHIATKKIFDYPGRIFNALKVLKIAAVREYRFLHDRRFKFDIAIPEKKICIEFEGGIYSKGRHTRGKGFARDAKKYNLAVIHGWKLLRCTTADVKEFNWEFRAADEIKKLIEGKI